MESYEERKKRLAPLNAELERLNAEVRRALRERFEWMNAHMDDYSYVHVGDPAWKRTEYGFVSVGNVRGLTRFHARNGISSGDIIFDTDMSITVEFSKPGSNSIGHSAQMTIYTEEQVKYSERSEYERLKRQFEK